MAMTRKEAAELAAAKSDLRMALALRWSGLEPPERMPVPEHGYVNGYGINSYTLGAREMWSENVVHGFGHRDDDGSYRANRNAAQDGRRLYRTKRDALIALRLEVERRFAEQLAAIDAKIAAEVV